MRPIRYAALSDPHKKKSAPSLTGYINPKVLTGTIAYKSANVHIKTFNFIFAQQAVIVYFYLCSDFQEIATPNTRY